MISVVIPTVQKKLEVLYELLVSLSSDKAVDEILLINNKPEQEIKYELNKLKIYTPKENLYVNKSWNLGVSMVKNDNFVLMNDDLLVCQDLCKMVVESDIFNNKDTGLIGVSPAFINQFANVDMIAAPQKKSEENIRFSKMNKFLLTGDWGIAIFGRKENYYVIPDDLKIIYGDNYLLYKNLENNKTNYSIINIPFNHIHSSSSASSEFASIIANDIKSSKKYFPKKILNKSSENYTISYKDDICFVAVIDNNKKNTICLKYKSDNEIFSSNILKSYIAQLLKNVPDSLIDKIVDDIIGQNKVY